MYGLGTLINMVAVIVGGLLGLAFGRLIKENLQDSLKKACGVSVMFIGITGALEGMLSIDDGKVVAGGSVLVVICLTLGTAIGEIINIEGLFEKFGGWLKRKTGSCNDGNFIDGFLSATFTISIGAMSVVGAMDDALKGDISILLTKSILDFIIILVMTGSMGKGCIFSAIPVVIFQGTVTALSIFIQPFATPDALRNLSMVGAILIFCVGINIVWSKKIRAANMLPSILFAVAAAFLPISF